MYVSLSLGAFSFFAGCVSAHSDAFISSLSLRQAGPSTLDCNATCALSSEALASCRTPHCGCHVPFLQAQGDCLLCQANTPGDEANVQFLLDAEMAQCHSENIEVDFQLDLPPAAAAIVQKFNRDSATLRKNQSAYLGLQIAGGHIGLVIVLACSLFSKRTHQDPTFINFCITWIFSSIVFSLLLYRRTPDNNFIDPLGIVSPNRCAAQAALTEGAQVMTAASTLALIIQLWLSLRIAIHGDIYGPKHARWTTGVLLTFPYILFLAFAISSAFVGSERIVLANNNVQRALPMNFYCIVIRLNSFMQAVYAILVALLTLTVVFDALIISVLYKNWRAFRRLKSKSAVPLSVLLRFIAFSIFRVVVTIAYVSVLSRLPELNTVVVKGSLPSLVLIPTWVDMLQAAIPVVASLVLGVNANMLDSLMFWRWFRRSDEYMYGS